MILYFLLNTKQKMELLELLCQLKRERNNTANYFLENEVSDNIIELFIEQKNEQIKLIEELLLLNKQTQIIFKENEDKEAKRSRTISESIFLDKW